MTVFPTQGIVIQRNGQDSTRSRAEPTGRPRCTGCVLASITDEPFRMPKPKPDAGDVSREDVDRGFFEAAQHPDQVRRRRVPAAAAARPARRAPGRR